MSRVVATVFTVGHSTRPLDTFLALLEREGVRRLIDVRTFPGSRRYPHFNRETLATAMDEHDVLYEHAGALGGRRSPRPDSVNHAWRNDGFRGYADYMETDEFRHALDHLIDQATERRTAIMCAEAVPWRCHRSLIADSLVARGIRVLHIMDGGSMPHTLTSFATVRSGRVVYGSEDGQSELFATDGA